MKTALELLNEKVSILVINFHSNSTGKTIFVLNTDIPDLSQKFVLFNDVHALEQYTEVEHLTPKSARTQLKFAIYPKRFALSLDLISRMNYITPDDAEYEGCVKMLTSLYAKHSGIAVPPEKKIEIATS